MNPFKQSPLRVALALPLLTASLIISPMRAQETLTGEQLYQKGCASCHGEKLQGGQAQSLVDAVWQFGSSRGAILSNVKHGIPDFSMPAFASAYSDKQINLIIDFLLKAEKTSGITKPPPPKKVLTVDYEVGVEIWTAGLNLPWGITFLDADRALVTERPGQLRLITAGKLSQDAIQGTPKVIAEGQGGLLDVATDPKYHDNGWIYLSFSHSLPPKTGTAKPLAMTRLVRGRIKNNAWTDEQSVYEAPPQFYTEARHHYGSRFAFDPAGQLYFSVGERGQGPEAQDLSRPNGKIHRIHPDGSVPRDNPFVGRTDALPTIFTYGNRNPQGLAVHPVTGRIWETEHGPMGGDELNLISAGRNYGWPQASYGRNYDGAPISAFREKPGLEAPALYWNPSIAVCGMDFVRGDLFPRWKNKLLVSALKFEELRLLNIQQERVMHQEIILKSAGRVRDVECGPDGAIYVVLNGPDLILRLKPLRDINDGP